MCELHVKRMSNEFHMNVLNEIYIKISYEILVKFIGRCTRPFSSALSYFDINDIKAFYSYHFYIKIM